MWRQHFFSKLVCNPQGDIDEYHILTSETKSDYQFTKLILHRDGRYRERRIAFIQDCGDSFYIGADGKVPDVLGESFPYAYEQKSTKNGPKKGREITFVHGYFAPKGSSIPGLDELLQQHKKHLKEILERANAGESPVTIEPTSFSRQRSNNTDWDQYAGDVENGKYPMQGMTFTIDGKKFKPLNVAVQSKEKSPTKLFSSASQKDNEKERMLSLEREKEKKNNRSSLIPTNQKIIFQIVIIGLVIVLIVAGLYLIL